jgi:hypothetical protein
MVRDSVFNPSLEREHRELLHLQQHDIVPAGTLPRTIFFGYHGGLAIIGETIVAGDPFEARSQFDSNCPYAQAAVRWIIQLSARTVAEAAPTSIADDFQLVVDRFASLYDLPPFERQFLNDQVEIIRRQPPSRVFEHGDAGTWNLLVTAEERVAFLDWENATPQGIPLWDLFYFLRAYCVAAGQKSGNFSILAAFEHFFLEESVISPLIVDTIRRYCEQVSMAPALVQPLFYLCWVFWAIKQAAIVGPSQRETAHFRQLLKLCIDRRNAPTLTRIFSL